MSIGKESSFGLEFSVEVQCALAGCMKIIRPGEKLKTKKNCVTHGAVPSSKISCNSVLSGRTGQPATESIPRATRGSHIWNSTFVQSTWGVPIHIQHTLVKSMIAYTIYIYIVYLIADIKNMIIRRS